MRTGGPLLGGLGAALLLAGAHPAAAQQQIVHVSIDWQGPTIALPDSSFLTPITEADILVPGPGAPGFAPLARPSILYSGGPGPIPGLGLALYPGCVGHPPGVPCGIEVDALSFGWDLALSPPIPLHALAFSTDEFALGIPGLAVPPTIWTEAAAADLAGDVLVSTGLGPMPAPPFVGPLPGSVALLDADGVRSTSGFLYPGVGLFEPRPPIVAPVSPGDNVDALEIDPGGTPGPPSLYFSLDAPWPDPLTGLPHGASAGVHGFVGGDVLVTPFPGAGPPLLYAPAPLLGLDLQGADTDDLDALILWENGQPGYQPSLTPGDWLGGQTDMLLFSVRRGSAVVGRIDSILGLPIEPGDVLTTPLAVGAPPGILIAAENLGLATVRSGLAPQFGDEVDGLDSLALPVFDCNANGVEDAVDIALGGWADGDGNGIPDVCQPILPYCTCPAPLGPCGNNDPNAGCVDSTGVGALLTPTGGNSVALDNLVLTGTGLPPKVFGLMISGSAPVGPLAFGDGLRCVGGLVTRWPVKSTGAAGTIVYGPGLSAYSVANFALARRLLPGTTWHFQLWFRDPSGPCLTTFNLSNAVRVIFVP